MKIAAISDLHGFLPEIPSCDLLLLGGDLCPIWDHSETAQRAFLDGPFRDWLEAVPARQVVGVAGNHDFLFERAPERVPDGLRWAYLQDSGCEFEGLRVWGSPWQTPFGDWAFNAEAEHRARIWSLIPAETDVLLLHGPPRGYGDRVARRDGQHEDTGCPLLLDRIRAIAPRLVVFGHIHQGRGAWSIGPTTLANVSYLDENYVPAHLPFIIDLA